MYVQKRCVSPLFCDMMGSWHMLSPNPDELYAQALKLNTGDRTVLGH
jgi:hypothetical protein